MMNAGVTAKNWMTGVSCEKCYMESPSTCVCECNKACKIYKYLDIKNCCSEKHLIGRWVL